MESERVKKIYEDLKGSRLVELWYENERGEREIQPGYICGFEDRRLDDVPDQWKDHFRK